MVAQVAGPDVPIVTAGGAPGRDPRHRRGRVLEALRTVDGPGAVVLADLGSSLLSVRAALAELSPGHAERIVLADGAASSRRDRCGRHGVDRRPL